MALISNSRYVSKSLGEYTIQICKKTNYFNALHLFKVYNDTYEKQKLLKRMNEYIKRAKFMKQVVSDFNYIANKKLLDYEFLNNLCDKKDGRIMRPVKISTDTDINDLTELDKGIKFEYMIREKKDINDYKIISLDINPMSAIGLAMWLNPAFGSEVKDVFLRFIEGDVSLIKETVENLNNITGKVNNINVATNPEDGSAVLLLKTYEKDSFDANYEYNKLKKEMIEMENMYKGIITEKDDKIDKLTLKIDQLLGYAVSTKNTLDDTKIILTDTNNKLIDISAYAEDTNKKLIDTKIILTDTNNKLDDTKIILTDTNNKLDDTKIILTDTNKKLTEVLPQRVNIDMITDPDVPQVYILYDRNAGIDEYDLYVMRCQTSGFNSSLKKIRKKYGNNIHKIYTVKQPNAVLFWRDFKLENKDNINKGLKSNWFKLVDIDIQQFKNNLNEFEKKRITKE